MSVVEAKAWSFKKEMVRKEMETVGMGYLLTPCLKRLKSWLLISLRTNSNIFNVPTRLCTGVPYHYLHPQ